MITWDRRSGWAAGAVCALFAVCAGWAAPAHAWTRTSVHGVAARLTVGDAGEARVALELELRVHGGWLSQLELTGLDADLALDPSAPAWFLCEDGTQLTPAIEVAPGRVLLSFPERRAAPHRGLHRLGITYTTRLASSGARMSWSLPPWSEDLRDVNVWVDAPRAATLGAADDADAATTRERSEHGARALLHFQRAQLPRTLPFAIEFELPGVHDAPRAASGVPLHLPRPSTGALWAAALVLALASIKRRAVRALCAREAARPLALIALAPTARAGAMLALAAAAAFAYDAHPSLALLLLAGIVLLALERGFRSGRAQPPPPASDSSSARLLARAQTWFGAAAWLDATAPLGLGLLASIYALAAFRLALHARPGLWLETLLLVTPLWLTSTHLQLPRRARSEP